MRLRKESVAQKPDISAFENIFTETYTFNIKDSYMSEQDIITNILSAFGVLSGGNYYTFSNSGWKTLNKEQLSDKANLSDIIADLSINSALEIGAFSTISLEGDTIVNGDTFTISIKKPIERIGEEITEITQTTHAFYDLEINVFTKDKIKVFTCLNEVEISLNNDSYKVVITNKNKKRLNTDKMDRFSSLDMKDSDKGNTNHLPDDTRFDDLDIPQRKKKVSRGKDGYVMNPSAVKKDPAIADRFKTLDLNNYSRKYEDELTLIQNQDQSLNSVLGKNLAKTATQKLGKQNIATQQQVSPSVQKQADKMTYAQAYDFVEDVYDSWEETDAYRQYEDTVNLVNKWYHQEPVTLIDDSLMGAFKYIDDLYKASELARKISKLEDEISKTKSRSTLTSLKKDLSKTRDDFDDTMSIIGSGRDKLTVGKDTLDSSTHKLESSLEDYIEDYMNNNALWKSINGKMEKLGKQIETMEALKNKYVSHLDLPPLLYRYRDLMATPLPTLIDVESLKINDVDVLYKAWYADMQQYRKAIESFNDSFKANYDALARTLALKSKERSLF